jgi:DNA-binding LacI/PurR family transcriptional regulator
MLFSFIDIIFNRGVLGMGNETITVYDIAKEAGVSPATVSRVLTNSARVSEDKKTRVQEIIKKYEFEPNSFARSLSKQESKTIGMIVPDIRNPFYAILFVNCEIEANRYGYNMILCNTISEISSESGHMRNLSEKRVDAIIQVGGNVDETHPDPHYISLIEKIAKKIPTVIAGEFEGANVYRIIPELTHGMSELMPYLTSLGHKEIALIGGRDTVIPTVRKRVAFKNFMEEHGLTYRKEYIIDAEYTIEGGYEGMQKLFAVGTLPDAIVAINESAAMGIYKALKQKGIRVPDDISVVGYDDTFYSEMMTPQLTCISYNLKSYSEIIMDTIINLINKNDTEMVKYVPTNLVERGSCRKAN